MTYRIFWFLSFVLTGFQQVHAQPGEELQAGYYVTVAAYSKAREDYAQKFTAKLKDKGLDARYGFNTSKNLYFVYLSYFTSLKPSLIEMQKVRDQGEFTDAWVRVVTGDIPREDAVSIQETGKEKQNAEKVVE